MIEIIIFIVILLVYLAIGAVILDAISSKYPWEGTVYAIAWPVYLIFFLFFLIKDGAKQENKDNESLERVSRTIIIIFVPIIFILAASIIYLAVI